jgi:protoporphyrinogen oxidase/glycosyltransferase involved in cell wall biosynthesis
MIVFSHLRWDFVFQRPQQLMTRMAQHFAVYFFEEPVVHDGPAWLEITERAPNLFVCRPHTPLAEPGFAGAQLPVLQRLLDELITSRSLVAPVVWFYTPMALPLLQRIEARFVVYDCMDELAAFLNAPPELIEQERGLLNAASIVFTGGPSLYRSKLSRHPDVHCFPSSVEREHFGRAADPSIDHAEQRDLPHPRLGFFGVIDERFDPAAIDLLAQKHGDWQIVLVGPVVKIDPAVLPRRANIHYMGQRAYAELPQFLAGWDVALLPFAINEATRFISPTKVLEYMAAGKRIVSTPVTDVVEPYSPMVHIARDAAGFVTACEQALLEPSESFARRAAQMHDVVSATSWDATVARMHALILDGLRKPAGKRAATRSTPVHHRAVVIGGGPTGLSAAFHLGKDSLLLEQNDRVGGWCRSVVDQGFTFDHAGHIMFSNDPYVHELYTLLLGDNVHWQDREAWIYSKQVYTRYPFQGALYGLPHEVLKECIVGAIEARFGPLKGAPSSSLSPCKAESITDCCADGITASATPLIPTPPPAAQNGTQTYANFEEFIYGVWGWGVAKHFAIPYNRKLWAVPLSEMETSWLGGRVPLPDLEEMIDGALRPVAKPQGPNARFGYPLRGGFQALMDGFLPHLRGDIKLEARVSRVVPSKHQVVLADGGSHSYDKLISTMPLTNLVDLVGDEAPLRVRQAARQLRQVSVRCVNLGVAREKLTDKHWIYYPEDTVFHRIFVQGNASPHNNAPGGFALTCEITYSPQKPLPCDGEALIDLCIADCIRVGMFDADDVVVARNQVDMPCAYVVYDHARAANVAAIRDWLAGHDIELAGRYAEWEYYNSDHAFIAGKRAAEKALASLPDKATGTRGRRRATLPLALSLATGS